MSRIGNKIINVPAGVTLTIVGQHVEAKGPKGVLTLDVNSNISLELTGSTLVLKRANDEKEVRSIHGTSRALIQNMVTGVSAGFEKQLEIQGTGYRAQLQGKTLVVSAGYSHTVNLEVPAGLSVVVPAPTDIRISGFDKQLVGQFAAEVRAIRKPEPYKGKGIRYRGEYVRRKEGKKAK